MANFKKKTNTSQEIPTSALPDIIFMLLFFFMVVTKMRETEIMVKTTLPKTTQLMKMSKENVAVLYIGEPKEEADKRNADDISRIQANDKFIEAAQVQIFVDNVRGELEEPDRPKLTISLRVDKDAKMSAVVDVKQELRKAEALKVNYAAVGGG